MEEEEDRFGTTRSPTPLSSVGKTYGVLEEKIYTTALTGKLTMSVSPLLAL
jgi:hypothetical protein